MRQAELFADALERPEAERIQYLESVCGSDSPLLSNLLELLEIYHSPAGQRFLLDSKSLLACQELPPDSSDLELLNSKLDHKFVVVKELGRGSMGVVYLARQKAVGNREIALKVLWKQLSGTSEGRKRFRAEVSSLANLHHPHVVEIYDFIEQPDFYAFAMEYVRGCTLDALISARRTWIEKRERSALSPFFDAMIRDDEAYLNFVLRTLVAVGTALDEVHRHHILHRDVKPSNILLRENGDAALADFGHARNPQSAARTESDQFMGTRVYSAPEQLKRLHAELDGRCDVYSLGVTMYEALALVRPYSCKTEVELLHKIERHSYPGLRRMLPRHARELHVIAEKAMDSERALRYASAGELVDDLQRFCNLEPIVAQPPTAANRLWKLARRHRVALLSAAIGLLIAAGFATALLVSLLGQQDRLAGIATLVRASERALLDPGHRERAYVAVVGGTPAAWEPSDLDKLEEAQIALAEAVELMHPDSDVHHELRCRLRAIKLAQCLTERRAVPEKLHSDSLASDLPLTMEVACEWLDESPQVRLGHYQSRLDTATPSDLLALGWLCFLGADARLCIAAWSRLPLERSNNPFIEFALGEMYIAAKEPKIAVEKLLDAVQTFSEVGFLYIDLADAALEIGDIRTAKKALERSRHASQFDAYNTRHRVWADYWVQEGDLERAEKIYRWLVADPSHAPKAVLHYADLLEARNERWQAIKRLHDFCSRFRNPIHKKRLADSLATYWESLSIQGRIQWLEESLQARFNPIGNLFQILLLLSGREADPAESEARLARSGLADLMLDLRELGLSLDELTQLPEELKDSILEDWQGIELGLCWRKQIGLARMYDQFRLGWRPWPFRSEPHAGAGKAEIRRIVPAPGEEGVFGLHEHSNFGGSPCLLSDLNADGLPEILISASGQIQGGFSGGVVHILSVNERFETTLISTIGEGLGDFPGRLGEASRFGYAASTIGDLDGDGLLEVAIAELHHQSSARFKGQGYGAIWILFLDRTGQVRDHQLIAKGLGGFTGHLDYRDYLGIGLTGLGDLDGDGIPDIAAGAHGDDDGCEDAGAIWILFLNRDGSVKRHKKLSLVSAGLVRRWHFKDEFGRSMASPGDLDGDGTVELFVSAIRDDQQGPDAGAVWCFSLDRDANVRRSHKLTPPFGTAAHGLYPTKVFGQGLAILDDLDQDGIPDLLVGALQDNDGGESRGAFWVFHLTKHGRIRDGFKVSDRFGSLQGQLQDLDRFGAGFTYLGDRDRDGRPEIVVSLGGRCTVGTRSGAFAVVSLRPPGR